MRGTTDIGLVYGNGRECLVTGYSDSDYAADVDTRRSVTGYVFTLGGSVVSWKSTLQSSVTLSTTEAEYMALTSAAKESIWLKGLVGELGIAQDFATVYCDSLSAICLAKDQVHHDRTKHIDVRYHFLRTDKRIKFLINNDDDLITSTADDVIFHGRLLPYIPPPRPRRSLSLSSAAARLTRPQLNESSSLSPPNSFPSIRPSRSLNYRKLRRNRSNTKPKTEAINRSSCNGNTRFNSDKSPAKLPWYWALVFGLPKIPAEMELKDIKNRQFRRNSTPPPPPSSRFFSGDRSCSSASWKLLNVLSCKSHATVDVSNTAPFRNSLF
uniref:Retrovirus-related Pol polyprotein from transposon TNT 1-94 n=1 Tax=Chenopodium quinoa TaxID=63459 RepID=A0A803MPL7_CHEQI